MLSNCLEKRDTNTNLSLSQQKGRTMPCCYRLEKQKGRFCAVTVHISVMDAAVSPRNSAVCRPRPCSGLEERMFGRRMVLLGAALVFGGAVHAQTPDSSVKGAVTVWAWKDPIAALKPLDAAFAKAYSNVRTKPTSSYARAFSTTTVERRVGAARRPGSGQPRHRPRSVFSSFFGRGISTSGSPDSCSPRPSTVPCRSSRSTAPKKRNCGAARGSRWGRRRARPPRGRAPG